LADGTQVRADRVIVAAGGTSRPETGSTGDALPWLAKFKHTTETAKAALVPVAVAEHHTTKRLGGVALSDCLVTVYADDKKVTSIQGKVLFAHFGLTGPAILNLSQQIGLQLEENTRVSVTLDLCPQTPHDVLAEQLLMALIESPNKLVRNILPTFVPAALSVPLLESAHIPEHKPSHNLTVAERHELLRQLKSWRFTPTSLLGTDKAVVTSGGVALTEVDFRTMESRLVPGLYLIGDVLDINRPSGGYSLQLAWTTGYVAGRAASSQSGDHKRR
jgi:hypothetical protein